MENESYPNGEFSSNTEMKRAGSSSYAGAFFPRSSRLFVAGGTFTSNVTHTIHHAPPRIPADFRRIPWGDIDLRHEIGLNPESRVAHRECGRGFVRRMYQAKIDGREADMTVAEGDQSKEQWRQDIFKYTRLRHPNILQIFGVASSYCAHAIVIHGDLIPFHYALELFCHSHFATVYIYGRGDTEYYDVANYLMDTFQTIVPPNTLWMRRSTGRLCVELAPRASDIPDQSLVGSRFRSRPEDIIPLNDAPEDARVIASLELPQYHWLCYLYLRHHRVWINFAETEEFNLGAVYYCPQRNIESIEISSLNDLDLNCGGWETTEVLNGYRIPVHIGQIMENGWTRCHSCDVFDTFNSYLVDLRVGGWLSQANHIFHRLQVATNYEDYVLMDCIEFTIRIAFPTRNCPAGYLFACPHEYFRTGPASFRWPRCPAYWSLVPEGVERLSEGSAKYLGFPSIELTTEVFGRSC